METKGLSPITLRIEAAIRAIPRGKISTYGGIAKDAGLPNGARQVARILHSRSGPAKLPWWRVLGKASKAMYARISLKDSGFDEQRALLVSERVEVSENGEVDLGRYGWTGRAAKR
jgi:methylated-DNA-protein-cysteine methyltransferase related protein